MPKKWLICLAGALVLSLALAGCGGGKQPEVPTGGNEPPKVALKVGTEAAYAPFEYEENGQITGFDADLIRAVAQAIGMEAQLTHVEWDGLFPALDVGTVDVVISAMTITDERLLEVDFSDPYFEARQIIAVKQGAAITGMKDLVGKKVGVQSNTTGHYAVEKLPGMKDKDIIKFPTTPDALYNLGSGAVAAVVADEPVVLNFIKHNPEMKLATVTDEFEKEYYGIALKKGNPLVQKINEGLAKVVESGEYDRIYNKYFGK